MRRAFAVLICWCSVGSAEELALDVAAAGPILAHRERPPVAAPRSELTDGVASKASLRTHGKRLVGAKWTDPMDGLMWYGINGMLDNQQARSKPLAGEEGAMDWYWAYEAQAWATVFSARKFGPHRIPSDNDDSLQKRVRKGLGSAEAVDWYFLVIVLGLLVMMDTVVLQQLPETARTHVILLGFWLLVAVVFAMEVWLHVGPSGGIDWLTGYALELIYSLDNVFVLHLIFCTFETPRRLVAKALSFWLVGSMVCRMLFFLGLASTLDRLFVIPYFLGLWLVYCGTTFLAEEKDDIVDVTQTTVVRSFRGVLGERLGEFYDEESEAVFVKARGQYAMTLLGIVIACLLTTDIFCGLDVVLTKIDYLPNTYLNFSSSALAVFTTRALFFVARDIFNRCRLSKYGIGLVLLFIGAETLLSNAIYVNALMSCLVIMAITVLTAAMSSLQSPYQKTG